MCCIQPGLKLQQWLNMQVVSKEFLEGCLRCLASMCFASQSICHQLSSFSKAPLVALYQHSSPKIQVGRPTATQSSQQAFLNNTCSSTVPSTWYGMQERACQLTAALTMDREACKSLVPGSLQGLLDLCSMDSVAAVKEQACYALCRLARPSAGCHACSHLQAARAALTLLHFLQGMHLTPDATTCIHKTPLTVLHWLQGLRFACTCSTACKSKPNKQ